MFWEMVQEISSAVLGLFVSIAAGYGLAAVFHEMGHLAAGLAKGGTWLLLRIGCFIFLPGSRRCLFGRGRYASPGQCILLCATKKECEAAALGGGFANLVTAGAAIGLLKLFHQGESWIELLYSGNFGNSFIIVSLLMAAVNLLPIPGQENDGRLCYRLHKDPASLKKFLWEQQKCMLLLESGQLEELLGEGGKA